jgi:hypothetical protein
MMDEPANTSLLFNPLSYTEAVTKGDYYLDSTYKSLTWSFETTTTTAEPYRPTTIEPEDYRPRSRPRYDIASATTRGLAVQSGFALLCLALATLKWRQTRRDMLRDPGD